MVPAIANNIDVRFHYVPEAHERGVVRVSKIHTDLNKADIFTKASRDPAMLQKTLREFAAATWKRERSMATATSSSVGAARISLEGISRSAVACAERSAGALTRRWESRRSAAKNDFCGGRFQKGSPWRGHGEEVSELSGRGSWRDDVDDAADALPNTPSRQRWCHERT